MAFDIPNKTQFTSLRGNGRSADSKDAPSMRKAHASIDLVISGQLRLRVTEGEIVRVWVPPLNVHV
eukprot:11343056-Heterocapsa_arctica.AAC.1